MISIKATGIEETIKALNDLDIKTHTKILKSGVHAITADLTKQLEAASPVGLTKSSASIKYGSLRQSVREGGPRINTKRRAILDRIFMNFWWRFLELGTQDRQTKSGAFRGRMTDAKRFLNPVVESFASSALGKFTDQIAAEITKRGLKK